MIRLAIIGYGYWGPNVVRNFSRISGVSISWVVDINPTTLVEVPKIYPTIQTTSDIQDVIHDKTIDGVVIVTPPRTHFTLASTFLNAGFNVLVEKPMTQTTKEARTLVALAEARKKILMVDHTFIYTPAVTSIKQILDSGELGDVYYIDSVRTNLGLIQKDSNVIYDLAVHDFSIIDYLFGMIPKTISATGYTHKEIRQETVAHISAVYDNNLFVHCNISWLSPIKIRRMMFIGTKKMLVYDDIEQSEKIKIYDKGVSFIKDPKQALQMRIGYRSGNMIAPNIPIEEGLFGMAEEYVRALETKKKPLTDGNAGLRVVRCLELSTKSLRTGGKSVRI